MRVAVSTKGKRKLSNKVADTFSHAAFFTIITIENKQPKINVIPNPGSNQKRGAGPIAVTTLQAHDIDLVIASEIGPGSIELLEHNNIEYRIVATGLNVKDVLNQLLHS